jgi:hypothetical protein
VIAHVAGLPFEELLLAAPALAASVTAFRAWAGTLRHRRP